MKHRIGAVVPSGSFAAQLVTMKFVPPPFRSLPVILVLGGGPLVVLLYRKWRIRLRRNLRGLVTATPIEVPRPA